MDSIPVAGVDVSKHFSNMCILAPDNSVFQRIKIYQDLTSMKRALATLQRAEEAFATAPIIIMESTSHYHRLLRNFMTQAGFKVIVINPLQSNGLKKINVRKNKKPMGKKKRVPLRLLINLTSQCCNTVFQNFYCVCLTGLH